MEILKTLWDGNIAPSYRKPTPKESALVDLIVKYQEKLTPMLSPEAEEIFDKLNKYHDELTAISDCETFVKGFCLGAKLMLEITEESP